MRLMRARLVYCLASAGREVEFTENDLIRSMGHHKASEQVPWPEQVNPSDETGLAMSKPLRSRQNIVLDLDWKPNDLVLLRLPRHGLCELAEHVAYCETSAVWAAHFYIEDADDIDDKSHC